MCHRIRLWHTYLLEKFNLKKKSLQEEPGGSWEAIEELKDNGTVIDEMVGRENVPAC